MTRLPPKDRILHAAEKLFADKGVDGTSIREICGAVNANQAAINYYFNRKEDLVWAVVESRMPSVAARRTELLDHINQKDEASVRDYVEALIIPLSEFIKSEGEPGQAYVAMISRLFNDRPDLMWDINLKYNGESLNRMVTGLSKILPGLPIEIISHRLTLSTNIMLQWLVKPFYFNSEGPSNNPNSSQTQGIYELIDFIVGGITAPPHQSCYAALKHDREG